MGAVDPRDVDTAPAPTQTTTTRAALVMANTENGVPRDAEREAAQTLRTEGGLALVTRTGHRSANGGLVRDADRDPALGCTTQQDLALVYANRAHSSPKPADEVPAQSVCTGGHLGVVIRQNSARGNPGQMATPAHEPIRTLTQAGHQSLVIPYSRRGEPGATQSRTRFHTLTTRDRLALVVPSGGTWQENATPAHEPRPTQTATESYGLAWGDDDIDDCRFRMFALHEIAAAMVMDRHIDGSEYIVVGNKRERMAQYGNAVTPPAMRALLERCLEVLG
jgi:DNA (cytosine-5)-methyltransferase 1